MIGETTIKEITKPNDGSLEVTLSTVNKNHHHVGIIYILEHLVGDYAYNVGFRFPNIS